MSLESNKKPMNVNIHTYRAKQGRFLDAHFEDLLRMRLLKIFVQASWRVASNIEPETLKSKFTTTIEIHWLIAATKAEHVPMPITKAKLG